MTNAYVLMTAMPPTKGHMNLVEFASDLVYGDYGQTHVIVCTQPDEPFAHERFYAVYDHFRRSGRDIEVHHLHRELEQNPEADGFWEMWDDIMTEYGFMPGDFAVTSEPYGKTLAERLDGVFMPYDPGRELYYTKATRIRENPGKYFADVAPEFQPVLRKTVTIFGAESTGKTTLSKVLSYQENGHWLFEYARPYLETAGNEITPESMHAIHIGQRAIQKHGARMLDKPWVIQDTDLFSTLGYWAFPHWQETLGEVPFQLRADAVDYRSDLYLITPSNIPFEEDPLRYGGTVREGSDEYWIGIAKQYKLNYRVLTGDTLERRLAEAHQYMADEFDKTASKMFYDRKGL